MSRNRKRQRHDDEERDDSDRNQHERQIKRPKRQLNRDLERDSAIPGNSRGRKSNDLGSDRRNDHSRRNDERLRSNDNGGDELEEGEFRPRGAGRNDMGLKDGPNQRSDRGDSRNQSPRSDSSRHTESPKNNFNRNSNSNFPRSQRSQDQPRWSKPKIQQKQTGQIKFNFNFGGKASNDKGNRFGNGQGRNGGSSKGQSGSNNKPLYKGGYNYKK
ncbi:hypothetical protein BKA69DRAFT_393814 [Paraphysoderma sedebokerense]|nr:hypothetical protein BKA69DRAFT_393814 [Paraphysoderma sedebokerense]